MNKNIARPLLTGQASGKQYKKITQGDEEVKTNETELVQTFQRIAK